MSAESKVWKGAKLTTSKEEFALINRAANEMGLMARITRIDNEDDEIDFIIVSRGLQ